MLSVFSFLSDCVLLGELDLKIFNCVFLTPLCQITRYGEFVLPLDSVHKKPYEVLILGRVQGNIKEALRKSEDVLPVPEHKLIVSIPCSLHSHKPPLAAVLAEFIKPDVECLELFARNLQPGWTSWGNEVLKFQHIDYFTLLQNETWLCSCSLILKFVPLSKLWSLLFIWLVRSEGNRSETNCTFRCNSCSDKRICLIASVSIQAAPPLFKILE